LVATVAVVDDGQPYAVPVACARWDERLLLHGSTGSRLFRLLAAGSPACVTVTLVDGLVLARSAFESSMNYRSVMVLGSCSVVADDDKPVAMQRLTEHLMPGRWAELRSPTRKELAATTVLVMPLTECSVKISTGGPEDPAADLDEPVWAGVVPIEHRWGAPVTAADLRFQLAPPTYVADWPGGRT
jgi:nitroimidazol reductase NimA-like FMN-containing flavoprotein (pyridoxamine 5'-phosphate oxidase superfamily)